MLFRSDQHDQQQQDVTISPAKPPVRTNAMAFLAAVGFVVNLGATGRTFHRWSSEQRIGHSIPVPFLILLIFWLSIVSASFGLFAPPNPTTVVALFLCALAVAGGIFLIEELDRPLSGFIQIPSDSMRKALVEITQ